jgi:hypothetical protein
MSDNYDDPRAKRDGHYARVNGFKEETRRQTDALRKELSDLKEKRRELRMSAASTAGMIGLRYLPETNEYVRMVRSVEQEIVLPEVVAKPEPLAPEQVPVEKSETRPVIGELKPAGARWLLFGDILLWVFALFVGYFIGLGLVTIAGMNWKAEPFLHIPAFFVGVSVVAALKLLVSQAWRLVGQAQALSRKYAWRIVLALLVTVGGCGLDAHLGASALRKYMEDRAFDATSVPDYWQLLLLALAITSPLLLASGFFAYEKAHREPSREEREHARHEREAERREAERRARLAKQEAEKAKHRAALQNKLDGDHASQVDLANKKYEELKRIDGERSIDWEEYRNNAEYKCLQGLIGQIHVLTVEISEKERELTSYRISRGYEKSSEFPNGKPTKEQAAEAEEKNEESDGDKPYAS